MVWSKDPGCSILEPCDLGAGAGGAVLLFSQDFLKNKLGMTYVG